MASEIILMSYIERINQQEVVYRSRYCPILLSNNNDKRCPYCRNFLEQLSNMSDDLVTSELEMKNNIDHVEENEDNEESSAINDIE